MNNWLNENKSQIDFYLSSKDEFLVDRKKHLLLMLELFDFYFPNKENLKFLDIGCGDGALTRLLLDRCPGNEFHLLDGSKTMLEKAKENIRSNRAVFFEDTFENFFVSNRKENEYDFIYSSMAIHHVEHHKKRELFSQVYRMLKNNGLFVNIDVVLPASAKTENFQFKMWAGAVNNYFREAKRENDIGKHDGLPASYKAKSENKPSTLESQLKMLEDSGFRDVECYHKNGIFVLYGCVK
jgi:ubiquinone/menaquinone biosynthesis C-methylase UbiE